MFKTNFLLFICNLTHGQISEILKHNIVYYIIFFTITTTNYMGTNAIVILEFTTILHKKWPLAFASFHIA